MYVINVTPFTKRGWGEQYSLSSIMCFFIDVLLYTSEGFLPFLQIFYSEFYRKIYFDQGQVEGETTNDIYKALLVSITYYHNPMCDATHVYKP